MRSALRLAPAVAAIAAILVQPAVSAEAVVPGQNGLVAFARHESGGDNIYAMNADGSGVTPLSVGGEYHEDFGPRWSPDGTRIAFIRNLRARAEVWVMNADGTGQTTLTSLENVGSVTWAPDGTRLAFTNAHDVGGSFASDIYAIGADGGDLVQLTNTSSSEYSPDWSPDGAKLVFAGSSSISVMDPDGTNVVSLGVSGSTPRWSPDGSQIAYSHLGHIKVAKADGTQEHDVTTGSSDETPSWAPDGSRLLFSRTVANHRDLFSINADGTGLTNLTSTATTETAPDWQTCPSTGCQILADDITKPSSSITRPRNGLSYYQANLTQFIGAASDAGSGVTRVEVSLRRIYTDGHCANWNGSVFVTASCSARNWRGAGGTTGWSYFLPRQLTKSKGTTVDHYLLLSRAIDAVGNIETLITNGRNRNSFEVI
jgi:TolB protein